MLNSGIGPVITKKKLMSSSGSSSQKKPMTPNPAQMYSLQMMNQNKMMNPNMAMQPNPMGGMKPQDPNMAMQQQQQPSTMKIENVSLNTAKKIGPYSMMNKGMISSPNLSQTSNPPKDGEVRGQMPSNPIINMTLQPSMANSNVAVSNAAAMKGNEKELTKTSEIPTLTLKIGSIRFSKDCKILTKIVATKKQFIWEVSELGSPMKGDEEGKGLNKRKFELKFSDIEKIDVNTENNSMLIETREKPVEFKEHNSNLKKTSQWVKESAYDTESEFGEDESKSGLTTIIATFQKDTLTKTQPGKMSHLDKLKRYELPLLVDGKSVIDSVPSTPLKTSSINLGIPGDPFGALNPPQLHSQQSFSQMLPYTSNKKDLQFPDLSLQTQNSLNLSRKESTGFGFDLHNFTKDTGGEKILEESPQGEAEEDDEDKEFPPLTKDKKVEVKRFESQLKGMKYDDKVDLIMETIKPKRYGANILSKKIFKCPLYKCPFNKTSAASLKSHLQQKHKRLLDMGFNVDENGGFTWKPELVDFSLMVAKIYPKFVKNIIKEAKKNP